MRDIYLDFCPPEKEKLLIQNNSSDRNKGTDLTYFSPDEIRYYERRNETDLIVKKSLRSGPSKIIWKEGDHIGSGSYGDVVMGLDKFTGTLMAVKKVHVEEMRGKNKTKTEALEQEISMYNRLSHKNIVGYLGCEKTKDSFNIFLEYIEGTFKLI